MSQVLTNFQVRDAEALEIYERMDAPARVRALAPQFDRHLRQHVEHPLVGEVRSLGLMGGIELAPPGGKEFAVPGKVGPRVAAELLARGVITRAIGDTLAFCPPMIITEAEMEELFAPLGDALDATWAWAKAEGHLG